MVDSDVSTVNRGRIIDHIKEMYGNVCKIQTLGYTKNPEKDEVGKEAVLKAWQAIANEFPKDKIPMMTKFVKGKEELVVDNEKWQWSPKWKNVISKGVKDSLDDIMSIPCRLSDDEKRKLIDIATHFCGRIDKVGVHASAVLVTPDDVTNYTPIEGCYSNDTSTGERVYIRAACYEYHASEAMGCMKLDILGLNTLDLIDMCLKSIGGNMNLEDIPMDDKETYDVYASGNLDGVFQMESPGMRRVAQALHVSNFDDVTALVALYRPGPIDSGMLQQYIDGKNGKSVDYLCDEYKEITENTFGIIVFQEQCMKLAMKMAGYSLGEADKLRKVIGRKEVKKIDAAVKEFITRCEAKGFSEEIATKVAEQIRTAGRYIFNYAHSVSYGKLSYKTAYLKAHYPLQFMCAMFNIKDKQEDIIQYFPECKRLGIHILPPDYSIGNRDWVIEGNDIRMGLSFIKGVGKNLVTECDSWESIVAHNNKGITEALVKAGALDYLGKSRGWMLANLLSTQKYTKRKAECRERIEFYDNKMRSSANDKEYARAERMYNQWKGKLNNTKFNEHPEEKYDITKGEFEVLSFSFNKLPDVLTGKAMSVHEFTTKNGNKMAMVTFDTEYGELKGSVAPFLWGTGRTRYGRPKFTIVQGHQYQFMMKKNGQYTDIVDAKEV